MCIYKSGLDPVLRKGMSQKVVAAAVDGFLCNDMSAVCCKCLTGVCDSCCTGGQCKCCASALKGCQPFFQDILGGVGQSAVNVTCVCKSETVCCVLAVMKYIGSSLVNGNRSGIGASLSCRYREGFL